MYLIPRGLEWNSDSCGGCGLMRKYLILKYKLSINLIRKYLATIETCFHSWRIRASGLPWTFTRGRVALRRNFKEPFNLPGLMARFARDSPLKSEGDRPPGRTIPYYLKFRGRGFVAQGESWELAVRRYCEAATGRRPSAARNRLPTPARQRRAHWGPRSSARFLRHE
jgi:hypothetical protein